MVKYLDILGFKERRLLRIFSQSKDQRERHWMKLREIIDSGMRRQRTTSFYMRMVSSGYELGDRKRKAVTGPE